jgi:hypothetical protein
MIPFTLYTYSNLSSSSGITKMTQRISPWAMPQTTSTSAHSRFNPVRQPEAARRGVNFSFDSHQIRTMEELERQKQAKKEGKRLYRAKSEAKALAGKIVARSKKAPASKT